VIKSLLFVLDPVLLIKSDFQIAGKALDKHKRSHLLCGLLVILLNIQKELTFF
jgi:hypothetical protein